MTAAAKILAPLLVALALSLQGCFLADYPWAVKIAIAKQCAAKAEELMESKGTMKKLHMQQCDKLDKDKMEAFGIDDEDFCKEAIEDGLKFYLGVECKATVGNMVAEKCGGTGMASDDNSSPTPAPEEDRRLTDDNTTAEGGLGFDADECKAAIQDAVDNFEPMQVAQELAADPDDAGGSMVEEEEEMEEEGAEATLALLKECTDAIQTAVASSDGEDFYQGVCADVTEEKNMEALEVNQTECAKYLGNLYEDIGVLACMMETMMHPDVPAVEDVTLDDIKAGVQDFMEQITGFPTIEELQGYVLDRVLPMMMGGPEEGEADRLRLFEEIRKGHWAGKHRQQHRSAMPVVAVASSLGLAILAAAAWRLRASRQGLVEEQPILEEEPVVA